MRNNEELTLDYYCFGVCRSHIFFLENESPLFYRDTRKKAWTQLIYISPRQIKACHCCETGAALPQESLLKAGKAGATRDSCGLELCWHRIVLETAVITKNCLEFLPRDFNRISN